MIERCLWITLVNLIVYFRTIYFGYVGDDIERSQREYNFKNTIHRYWAQFRCEKHIHPMVAHFLSLITHTLCCIMIYISLYKFTEFNNISFLTAILFSINPVNIQGSVWISGRNYVTATILTLSMLIIPALTPLFYYLTSFFAVNAWFSPLMFLGTSYWWLIFSIPLVWLISKKNKKILNVKLWETPIKTTNAEMRLVAPKKIIPFIKCFGYYFRLCLFPWVIGIDHKFLYGFGTNQTDNKYGYSLNIDFLIGIFCVLLPFFTYFFVDKWIGWGLLWFMVNIAMWCNFVTIQQQISQRYVYLANIGMMFALANAIYLNPVVIPVVIAVVITAYFTRLWYAMPQYFDDSWAIECCIQETRSFHYPWLVRGVKKFFVRDFMGAFHDFQEAYRHKPYDFKTLYNMAAGLFLVGNIKESRKFLELAQQNVYDEMNVEIVVPCKALDEELKKAEEQLAKSITNLQINLGQIMIVK